MNTNTAQSRPRNRSIPCPPFTCLLLLALAALPAISAEPAHTTLTDAETARDWTLLQAKSAPENGLWLDEYGATPASPGALQHSAYDPNASDTSGLKLGDRVFAHGIGAHIVRNWTMPVPDGAVQFLVAVGLRSGADAKQKAQVSFATDGNPAGAPLQISPGAPPVLVAIDLAGKQSLTLHIENAGNTTGGDDVVLGGALFVGRPGAAVRNPNPTAPAWSGKCDDPIPPGVDPGWPQWRGPLRNGSAVNSLRLADFWPPAGPKKLWETHDIKPIKWANSWRSGWGGPVVAQGRIYLYLDDRADNVDIVYCADATSGRMLWQAGFTGPRTKLGFAETRFARTHPARRLATFPQREENSRVNCDSVRAKTGEFSSRFGKVDRAVLLSSSTITRHQRAGWVLTPSDGSGGSHAEEL